MNLRLATFVVLFAVVATVGCQLSGGHNLPPAERLHQPGPGVGGPGPGVLTPPPTAPMPPMEYPVSPVVTQVSFVGPDGMQVVWDVSGQGDFHSEPIVAPGRHNFSQGGIYRLKVLSIPGRPGVELYPTLELGPTTPRTEAYLSHNAVPIQFTDEDFDQVITGNFVTKVIYLPDPEFQELAMPGIKTLVSTRLDPGVDPIVEADRRGAIMAVIRLGNLDLETPGQEGGPSIVSPVSYTRGLGGNSAGFASYGPDRFAEKQHYRTMRRYHRQPIGPTAPPNFVSGVTAPQYGMTMSGTPIGLVGPPHIPLGHPAGLQKHVMKNNTRMYLPEPSKKLEINVKQRPGFSYPQPATRIDIEEQTIAPSPRLRQPLGNQHQYIR